ncbi:MAG TPA: glycosyltransferase [Caulobacteraceae bacterium]
MLDVGELTRTELVSLAPSLRAASRRSPAPLHLIDTTMLFAPKSGGVKRYLLAKRAWLGQTQPDLRHTLVTPGARTRATADGLVTIRAPLIPFGDGYRIPASLRKWTRIIAHLKPSLIEAGDAYVPGHAALEAAEATGAAAIGFCHSDPAALAALHFGEWAAAPAQKRWAKFFSRFDRVIAPSQYIAHRLADAGVTKVSVQPLGVDTDIFDPGRADREVVRRDLDLPSDTRLLVFAGRPAREKNLETLVEAVEALGPRYRLMLIAAGANLRPHPQVIGLGYVRDSKQLARLIASCDAFVHANDQEPFGLIVLEAMAAGLPVVGPGVGGVSELIDDDVGQVAHDATPSGLAEAIDALFARDLEALSRAARQRAEDRHTWDRAFQGLMRTYGEVLGLDPGALQPRLDA